jgi:hypothetical protein
VVPQFTVPAKATGASVRVDERTATSKISVAVPRPATTGLLGFTAIRGDRAGSSSVFSIQSGLATAATIRNRRAGDDLNVWVSPTSKKATVGTLRSFTRAQLTSPPGPSVPYVYDLDFPGPAGRIPAQHFAVRASSLAAITERYIQDKPSRGFWAVAGGTVPELRAGIGESSFAEPLRLPGRQIRYMTATPAVLWRNEYWEFGGDRGAFGGQAEVLRSRRPGPHVTEEWNRYPLHPQPDVSLAGFSDLPFSELPSAARAGDVLSVLALAFGDNTPGHLGRGIEADPAGKTTGRWALGDRPERRHSGRGDGSAAIPRCTCPPARQSSGSA